MRFILGSRRWFGVSVCWGAWLVAPAVGRAQSLAVTTAPALDFSWAAPEGCPSREQVLAELSRAVDAGGKELPALTARAVVRQSGPTWYLDLATEMDGRHGDRQLQAESCEGLARAATLVLALTLGEGLARRQAEAEARAAPPTPPAQKPAPAPVPAPEAPPPARLRRGWVWLAAAIGSDPLAGVGPALGLGGAFQPGLLRFGARLEGTLPRASALTGSGGDLHRFSLSAGLLACLAPRARAFVLSACANGTLTLLSVEGRGTARDRHANVPLYGLGPSLGADWLFSEQAFLSLTLSSRFYLQRPALLVEGLTERRRVAGASVSAELGGGLRF